LLVALAVMLAGVVPTRQILAQRRAVAGAEQRLAGLEADNAALEAEVVALGSSLEVERRAREAFGYVQPGELAYVVVFPESVEPSPPVESRLGVARTEGWWNKLVNFFTGGDLVQDG
jgi:hypothetical protein